MIRVGDDMSRKAVALGAVLQTLVVFALSMASAPLPAYAPALLIGGVSTGLLSETLDREFIDGAVAGGLSVGVFLVLFLGSALVRVPLSLAARLDFAFVSFLHGLAYVIIALPMFGLAGAIGGGLAGWTKRRTGP